MTSPLDWTYATATSASAAHRGTRRATAAERAALAKALDILSCDELVARYEIAPLGGGRFLLRGDIEADVTQACVVTLDPVPAHLADRFAVELGPGRSDPRRPTRGEREVLERRRHRADRGRPHRRSDASFSSTSRRRSIPIRGSPTPSSIGAIRKAEAETQRPAALLPRSPS